VLCVCTVGVHNVREGILFLHVLSKCNFFFVCKKSTLGNNLNDFCVASKIKKMCQKSFSSNALIIGLEELGCGVLCLYIARVHHVREGIMFPPALFKCKKKKIVQKVNYE